MRMPISDIQIVAFGDPSLTDNAHAVLSNCQSLGAKTNFLTSGMANHFQCLIMV